MAFKLNKPPKEELGGHSSGSLGSVLSKELHDSIEGSEPEQTLLYKASVRGTDTI